MLRRELPADQVTRSLPIQGNTTEMPELWKERHTNITASSVGQ